MTTIRKCIERKRGKRFIVIDAELRQGDSRGLSDGFSITGAVYEPHGTWSGEAQFRNGRYPDASGAIHEEILQFAPELKPLVDVHLADPDGVPMHAVANGWYFYSGQAREYEQEHHGADYVARQGTDRERAARALHIATDYLPEGMGKRQFAAFAEALRPEWAEQARVAREMLERL